MALRRRGGRRLAVGLAIGAALGGVEAHGGVHAGRLGPAPEGRVALFEETVPGTAVRFEMVRVPGGEVEVAGAHGEPGRVDVAPFWMATTEVTWDLYDVFVYGLDKPGEQEAGADAVTRPSKPYLPPDRGWGHAGYPAISVTHEAAAEFCRWLSAKTGRAYRLPTEAEWQAACEAGGVADADAVAWHRGNAGGKTHPVGARAPNALGLHDLVGNAAEWCDGAAGPVVRGGSYADPPERLGCAARAAQDRSWNASDPQIPKSKWWLADAPFVGFRVVCVDGPEPGEKESGDE